jgi:outer membrane protein TolC
MSRAAGALALIFALGVGLRSQDAAEARRIDLATVLELAGARNLDIEIARGKVAEARAVHEGALQQFFPWLAPGISYRRHEGRIQATEGQILDVNKQSYAPAAGLIAQVEVGNAIYRSRETRQLSQASGHALDTQQANTILAAADAYFELARSQAAEGATIEAVRISRDYGRQVHDAAEAGVAFKGDELRVSVQAGSNQLAHERAREQRRIAAARLAQLLHLDSTVDLLARDGELVPLALARPDAPMKELVLQAMASRPENRQHQALLSAAREAQHGAIYGPLVPTIGAHGFVGGLGGGPGGDTGNFGESAEYGASLGWRIGPGGLFDFGRIDGARARFQIEELKREKARDEIARQVVEAAARLGSTSAQIDIARQSLSAAEETLSLSQGRKEFGVGIVLEFLQAEEQLTKARIGYAGTIAEFNQAQFALRWATGSLATPNITDGPLSPRPPMPPSPPDRR